MRVVPLLVLAIASSIASESFARCLSYAPTRVTLRGELLERTLPGPPNYKSIARGDRPETIYFVDLDDAICVTGKRGGTLNKYSHAGLTEIQLVIPPEYARHLSRKRVRATGLLLGAQTAAQRTPVVMSVKKLVADDD